MNNIPPVKEDLHEIESWAKPSITVNCLPKGFTESVKGRYFHGPKLWQIDGVDGAFQIIEWWPLPEIGTGNKVEGDSDE